MSDAPREERAIFGELRSAVDLATTSPERADAVLWLLLVTREAPQHAELVHYACDRLARVSCGFISLGEVVRWLLDAAPHLEEHIRFTTRGRDIPTLPQEYLYDWLCGMVWIFARNDGEMYNPIRMVNWMSVLDSKCHNWFGLGLVHGGALHLTIEPHSGGDGRLVHRMCMDRGFEDWTGLPVHLIDDPLLRAGHRPHPNQTRLKESQSRISENERRVQANEPLLGEDDDGA